MPLAAGLMGLAMRAAVASPPPDCPPPDTSLIRNAHLVVRFEGQGEDGACLQRVGGVAQAVRYGIWPAGWPEAAIAAQAARSVLAGPPGTAESFTASFEWVGNAFDSSVTWRFTVTNDGPATVLVAGQPRAVLRIGWDERSLGRAYKAHAEFAKDVETGAILAQSYRVVFGSATTSSDFWSRYGGGLGMVADYQVTALQ